MRVIAADGFSQAAVVEAAAQNYAADFSLLQFLLVSFVHRINSAPLKGGDWGDAGSGSGSAAFQAGEVGFDGFPHEFGSGGVAGGMLLDGVVDLVCECFGHFNGYPVGVSHHVSPLTHSCLESHIGISNIKASNPKAQQTQATAALDR